MLTRASKLVLRATVVPRWQYNKSIVGRTRFALKASSIMTACDRTTTYEIIRPEIIGLKKSSAGSRQSFRRHAFVHNRMRYGATSRRQPLKTLRAHEALADRKKDIYDE